MATFSLIKLPAILLGKNSETSKQIRKLLETLENAKKTSRKFIIRIPHVSSHSNHSIGRVSFMFLFLIQD